MQQAWRNIVEGKSGIARISVFDPSAFASQMAGEVRGFDVTQYISAKDARRMDRFSQFAVVTARQAVLDAGLQITEQNRDRIGVILGTGVGGLNTLFEQIQVFTQRGPDRVSPFLVPMVLPDTAAGMVAIYLGVRGPNLAVVSACASGTNAIGEAAEAIRRRSADVILTGGSEAVIVPIAIPGMAQMSALSTRNERQRLVGR